MEHLSVYIPYLIVFCKCVLLFILLQELVYRNSQSISKGLKGFQIRWVQQNWNQKSPGLVRALAVLILFLFVYTRPDFIQSWGIAFITAVVGTLIWAILSPVPLLQASFRKHTCKNQVEYYIAKGNPYFHSGNSAVKVFFHGAGTDGFFDNFELFNLWYSQGYTVVSFHLSGHGLDGQSLLKPETFLTEMEEAWNEAFQTHFESMATVPPIHVVGESTGGLLGLRLGVEHPEIQEVHSLSAPYLEPPVPSAPPHSLKLGLGIVWEFVHMFGFQLWWRLQTNSFVESLPFYVRAYQYPLRSPLLNNLTRKELYEKTIQHLIHSFQEVGKNKGVRKNPNLSIHLFHGLFDGVLPYSQIFQCEELLKSIHYNPKCHITRATHLSTKKWYIKSGLV